MAIKVNNTTVIDDTRNIVNANDIAFATMNGNMITVSSPSAVLNAATADAFFLTATANTTVSITNPPASGRVKTILLEIQNGGNFAITWPTTTRWPAGSPPLLTTNGIDIIAFYTDDAGANYRAQLVQRDSK